MLQRLCLKTLWRDAILTVMSKSDEEGTARVAKESDDIVHYYATCALKSASEKCSKYEEAYKLTEKYY